MPVLSWVVDVCCLCGCFSFFFFFKSNINVAASVFIAFCFYIQSSIYNHNFLCPWFFIFYIAYICCVWQSLSLKKIYDIKKKVGICAVFCAHTSTLEGCWPRLCFLCRASILYIECYWAIMLLFSFYLYIYVFLGFFFCCLLDRLCCIALNPAC